MKGIERSITIEEISTKVLWLTRSLTMGRLNLSYHIEKLKVKNNRFFGAKVSSQKVLVLKKVEQVDEVDSVEKEGRRDCVIKLIENICQWQECD